jgi:hypothetical protein
MVNALIFLGGALILVSIVALLDWWARRGRQQPHH